MSAEHTPGRLIFGPGMHGTTKLLLSAPDGGNITVTAYMAEADAERLAACWNACDGLSQDALDGGWTAKGLSQYAKSLELCVASSRDREIRLSARIAILRAYLDEVASELYGTVHASHISVRIREYLKQTSGTKKDEPVDTALPGNALPDTEGGSCD